MEEKKKTQTQNKKISSLSQVKFLFRTVLECRVRIRCSWTVRFTALGVRPLYLVVTS